MPTTEFANVALVASSFDRRSSELTSSVECRLHDVLLIVLSEDGPKSRTVANAVVCVDVRH